MDDQNSRQQRRSFVDSTNSAVSAGRRIYSLTSKARTAGILAANPEVWAVIGGVALIVLIVFMITFSTGEAANIPTDTNSGQGSQTSAPIAPVGGKCSAGVGLCAPENLSAFGSDATMASIVCNKESTGNSRALNDNCLLPYSDPQGSVDYSVGLFQINLLAQCPDAFSWIEPDLNNKTAPPGHTSRCEIGNQTRLDSCMATLMDKDANIKLALDIFNARGRVWSKDWGAALACGIL